MTAAIPAPQLRASAEQRLFRRLNSVVEPLVRRGLASSTMAPASLVILETIGFKSGLPRRTPLWSLRLGRYRLVSTARGDRSFWVRNLFKSPQTTLFIGGKEQSAEAILLGPGGDNLDDWDIPSWMWKLFRALEAYTRRGWAFALLVPAAED